MELYFFAFNNKIYRNYLMSNGNSYIINIPFDDNDNAYFRVFEESQEVLLFIFLDKNLCYKSSTFQLNEICSLAGVELTDIQVDSKSIEDIIKNSISISYVSFGYENLDINLQSTKNESSLLLNLFLEFTDLIKKQIITQMDNEDIEMSKKLKKLDEKLKIIYSMQKNYDKNQKLAELESEITGLFDTLNATKSNETDNNLGWIKELISDIQSNFRNDMNNHLADLNAIITSSAINEDKYPLQFDNINSNGFQIYEPIPQNDVNNNDALQLEEEISVNELYGFQLMPNLKFIQFLNDYLLFVSNKEAIVVDHNFNLIQKTTTEFNIINVHLMDKNLALFVCEFGRLSIWNFTVSKTLKNHSIMKYYTSAYSKNRLIVLTLDSIIHYNLNCEILLLIEKQKKNNIDLVEFVSGNYLLGGTSDGDILLWESHESLKLKSHKPIGIGHNHSIDFIRVMEPTNAVTVSRSEIKIWSLEQRRCLYYIKIMFEFIVDVVPLHSTLIFLCEDRLLQLDFFGNSIYTKPVNNATAMGVSKEASILLADKIGQVKILYLN